MPSISPNRITLGGAKRRGLAAMAVAVAVVAIAGCGGGGTTSAPRGAGASTGATSQDVSTPTPAAAPSPDGELLDKVLARQEAAVAAYSEVIPHLSPKLAQMASYFRTQEQEHVDGTLRALRNLYEPAEPSAETIDVGDLKSDRERLEFLYERESGTIEKELDAIGRLEASLPRTILASTVANQAQHLTLLRQALGAGPLASAPAPFEDGTAPPPGPQKSE